MAWTITATNLLYLMLLRHTLGYGTLSDVSLASLVLCEVD